MQTRMPEELEQAVSAEAARLGITKAEYVRSALFAFTAWHRALDAVDDGTAVEDLRDPATIGRILGTER